MFKKKIRGEKVPNQKMPWETLDRKHFKMFSMEKAVNNIINCRYKHGCVNKKFIERDFKKKMSPDQ